MSDWDEHRKKNPLTCQFCGETDPTVDMWCGAPWGKAHRKCAEIAAEGITLYLRRQLFFREGDYAMEYSTQRGWWCEYCGQMQYFKEGSNCEKCGKEMRVLMTYHSSKPSASTESTEGTE